MSKSLSLYSDNNPKTTISGFGYKDKKTTLNTINKVEKTKELIINFKLLIQCIIEQNIINIKQRYERSNDFKKWLNKYKINKKNINNSNKNKLHFYILNLLINMKN